MAIQRRFPSFEHMYCCIWIRHEDEELRQISWSPTRSAGSTMESLMGKCITVINMMISIRSDWLSEWENFLCGISQCNMVLDDLNN